MNLHLFSERLGELIFDSKLNAQEVATKIGISKTAIYEYLSGNKMPTVDSLVKIAEYFNCSTDFLLGTENDEYTKSFKPTKPFNERFGEVLKHYNISRYKLEQLTGISESTLYYWAKGIKTPSVESLLTVASKLDCNLDFLLGRAD